MDRARKTDPRRAVSSAIDDVRQAQRGEDRVEEKSKRSSRTAMSSGRRSRDGSSRASEQIRQRAMFLAVPFGRPVEPDVS